MTPRHLFQLFTIALIYVGAFFLINPMNVVMPNNVHTLMLVCMGVIAIAFAAMVLAEGSADEREEIHRAFAGRVAFFAGAVTLVAGISYQTISNVPIDPWLLLTLCAMVTGKVAARVFAAYTQ